MTEDDFAAFMNKHHLAEWSEIMVRVSVPGDYRSLVDTMPTKSLNISPIEYWKDLPDGSRDLLFEPE